MEVLKSNKSRNRRERRKKLRQSNSATDGNCISNALNRTTALKPNMITTVMYNKNGKQNAGKRRRQRRKKKRNKTNPGTTKPKPKSNKMAKIAAYIIKTVANTNKIEKDEEILRELLVNGYYKTVVGDIWSINPMNINDRPIIKIICLYLRSLTKGTERAIVSANFFGDIINQYQNDKDNKCPFIMDNNNDNINLNDYIYIRGGALRDTILSRDINDIDFVIDIIGLTKVYYDHLIKYHTKNDQQSMNCGCYLWQRYLRMYKYDANCKKYTDIDTETNIIKKLEKHIVRSDFLLNARFVKDIIMKSAFNTKVPFVNAINAINTWGYTNWVINIDKTIFYNGIDLKGSRFDVGDEMSNSYGTKSNFNKFIVDPNQMVFKANWNDCFDYLWQLKNPENCNNKNVNKFRSIKRNYDIVINKSVSVYNNNDNNIYKGNDELITIHLPIYSFYYKYSHQFCDFTINGMRLPLSNVYRNNNCIDFNWYSKIFNYSNNNNDNNDENKRMFLKHNKMAIDDITNKIIKQPDLNILTIEYMYDDYFWRFIKILTKFVVYIHHNIWKIDEKTLNQLKYAFKCHFKQLNDDKMKEFINRLLFWNINDNNFENVIKSRFMVFKIINIDNDLRNAFKVYPVFKTLLKSAIHQRLNDKKQIFVSKILNQFGYKNVYSTNGNYNGRTPTKRKKKQY